ncbi:carbohydrate esterase family 6 protein, partial [Piromyces sp. E2]
IATLLATSLALVSKTFAEPDPNFHIYLAFGQSNMYGSGPIEEQDLTVDPRFQMLSTVTCGEHVLGKWYDAVPPLADCSAGIGPVDYFGRTLVEEMPNVKVGVVLVAIPGCDIQLFEKNNYTSYVPPDWMEDYIKETGNNPYARLVNMAKLAQKSGVIKGILLHQGETNNGQEDWPLHVKAIYDDLIEDLSLKAEETPLIVGELVQLSENGTCGLHNTVIQKVPEVIPNSYVVSSEGLKQQGDGFHFTTPSYREFGRRFAEIMLALLNKTEIPVDTPVNTPIDSDVDSDIEVDININVDDIQEVDSGSEE